MIEQFNVLRSYVAVSQQIDSVVVVDLDNTGFQNPKAFLQGKHKPFVIGAGFNPRRGKANPSCTKFVDWCQEQGFPAAIYTSDLAAPDLTDHMITVAAMDWMNKADHLKQLPWHIISNDRGLQSLAYILRAYKKSYIQRPGPPNTNRVASFTVTSF